MVAESYAQAACRRQSRWTAGRRMDRMWMERQTRHVRCVEADGPVLETQPRHVGLESDVPIAERATLATMARRDTRRIRLLLLHLRLCDAAGAQVHCRELHPHSEVCSPSPDGALRAAESWVARRKMWMGAGEVWQKGHSLEMEAMGGILYCGDPD